MTIQFRFRLASFECLVSKFAQWVTSNGTSSTDPAIEQFCLLCTTPTSVLFESEIRTHILHPILAIDSPVLVIFPARVTKEQTWLLDIEPHCPNGSAFLFGFFPFGYSPSLNEADNNLLSVETLFYFILFSYPHPSLPWIHIIQFIGSTSLDPGRVLKDYFI
jgi:hypothetical protein